MGNSRRTLRNVALTIILAAGLILMPESTVQADQTDLVGPAGSGGFGESVTVLPNGNIVVTDPYYDAGSVVDVGAVYLYDGATGTLINFITGATTDDRVGSGGVVVLNNGNYVVLSPDWDNGGAADAGAATWGDGTAGVSGAVSAANSLVGSTADDEVGSSGVVALSNGNYVVRSPNWDNGGAADAGAATWGDGTTGITGAISSTNSLVGSTAGDRVGYDGVVALSNGNYVVRSPNWDNGGATNAGAATWGDGTIGVAGAVSPANSLVGATADDRVGSGGVTALSNGNYVVRSPNWDDGAVVNAGAATWGDGTAGIAGTVSPANSLVGSTADDQVGLNVTALSNGNYVVRSIYWDDGGATDAGAVTWGDGTAGVTGAVSPANSLVGSTAGDQVGYYVGALSNGNYVAWSWYWDNGGAANAGAVTWGDGTTGITGAVSPANSLVGSTANDLVGFNVTTLSNGNYVVWSPYWDNGGAAGVGAVTWGDGTTGITGAISSTNSLVGSTAGDQVGFNVTALSNGNYVVWGPYWDNGGAADAGAATWGDGTTGIAGAVSPANSLVGSMADDRVGSNGVMALSNGNYVVLSPDWDDGGVVNAGAATWGDGTAGIAGAVSPANSLVGSTADDRVGLNVTALGNGNYVVMSPNWDNGGAANAGAVTWGDGTTGVTGAVSSTNSLVGSTADDQVGSGGVTVLSNGNYVVSSRYWDNGGAADAGAATWGDGTTGVSGVVSSTNSLVGSTADDQVGYGVTALSNGNYVVWGPYWDNGGAADAGAVTWGSGTTGITGAVSPANSLVGSTTNDRIGWSGGWGGVVALSNGNYVVMSPNWDNGGATDAGAVTWGSGTIGVSGPITAANSVLGTTAGGGASMVYAFDETNSQLVVGRPADNIVTLFVVKEYRVYLPLVLRNY